MRAEIPTEELVTRGEMVQKPWDLSPSEYEHWQVTMQEKARKRLFAIGQPLVSISDGVTVVEHADGRIERY